MRLLALPFRSVARPSAPDAGTAADLVRGPLGRRLAAGRPPIVWSLALLFAFKSLVGFAIVAFPLSPHQPTAVVAIGGLVAVAAAWSIWAFGSRIPPRGFEAIAAVGVLATSALVAEARTTGGMMVAAFAYPWIAIYAAHFLHVASSRRSASSSASRSPSGSRSMGFRTRRSTGSSSRSRSPRSAWCSEV